MVRLKPAAPQSRVKHSTTEPLCYQRNLFLTAKLLKQGYRYEKIENHFLNSTTDTQSQLLNTTLG